MRSPVRAVCFHLVDIRDLDGELLLASDHPGDNAIAILTRLGGEPDAVQRVLKRIAIGPAEERDEALAELSLLSGLRGLGDEVKREAGRMPIQEDIRDHDYFGPLIRQGMMSMLEKQIEKKFGGIPPPIRERLDALKPAQIEDTSLRLLDAQRIEDLFAR